VRNALYSFCFGDLRWMTLLRTTRMTSGLLEVTDVVWDLVRGMKFAECLFVQVMDD
jgi:hypothetical protein